MTPGEEALREAARREAALVYGRIVREYKQPPSVAASVAEALLEEPDEFTVARRRAVAKGAA